MTGRVLGDRDHTTIIYAWRQAEYLLARDKAFAGLVREIERVAFEMMAGRAEAVRASISVTYNWGMAA